MLSVSLTQKYHYFRARSILHAAISLDGGCSWRGHREVLRDPELKLKNFEGSDHGVGALTATPPLLGSSVWTPHHCRRLGGLTSVRMVRRLLPGGGAARRQHPHRRGADGGALERGAAGPAVAAGGGAGRELHGCAGGHRRLQRPLRHELQLPGMRGLHAPRAPGLLRHLLLKDLSEVEHIQPCMPGGGGPRRPPSKSHGHGGDLSISTLQE